MKKLSYVLIGVIVLLIVGNVYLFLATDIGAELGLTTGRATSGPAPTDAPVQADLLPVMSYEELEGLLPAEVKMKTVLGVEIQPEAVRRTIADQADEVRSTWPDASRRLEMLITRYGFDLTAAHRYDVCGRTAYPVSTVELSASQLRTPDLARQFIDDPQALGMFTVLGTTYMPAANVHGWMLTSEPGEGDCFASEITHSLVFEYWGVLFSIDIAADAGADRAALQPLFDPLAAIMAMRVNVLNAPAVLPATPVPAAAAVVPDTVQFPLTLEFLEGAIPTDDVFGEDTTLVLNRAVSRSYTLDEYVAAFRSLNMPGGADALRQAGRQSGMVGQVVRVWDSQGACPDDSMLIALEMDFALFETAGGTLDYLNNQNLQAAWLDTGLVTRYTSVDRDTLFIAGGYPNHSCGQVEVSEMRQAYGRVLVAIAFTHYPGVPQADIRQFLTETMAGFDTLFAAVK